MLTWKQGFKIADTITFAMLVETRFEFKHRVLRGKSPFYNEELTALLKLLQTRDVSFVDFVRAKYPETLQVEAESSETETASEVIPEETLNSLWEQINAAIPAWKKKREGVGYASKGMFIHATLKFLGLTHDSETNSDVLEKLLHLLTGKRTNILEVLIKRQLRGESLWSADDAAEVAKPPEDKSAETSDNREVSKLLKKKKKRFKSIWDLRKQAAADYVGKGDTDLNRFLTLPELENGFARNHKFMADAFRSGMERISLATFHACEERTLASGVSLEDLNKEHQAIQTYAYDILIWQREEWIQQLIAQKKSVQADTELVSEVESETETDAPLPDESETAGLIEIVTEPEPESIASVPDPDGCRKVLQRTLSNQGMLNKSNVDARHLSEIYNISRGDVMRLKEEVWTQGLAKTIEKHKSVREVACMKWYGWPDLSDATTWDQVCDAACNQFAFLSKETFDGSREKPGFDDYKQLQREINQLEHFNLCLSEQAGWIQALIPETETESPPAEEREFQYAILTGVTLWYKERSPVPGGKAVETSTYVEFGDAIGNEDMGTGPENPLEALPLEVRQGLQKALEDV